MGRAGSCVGGARDDLVGGFAGGGLEIGGWFGVHREGVLVLTEVAARDAG
jgi:hypothetical protein